jgi:hypothetical protein
MQRKMNKLTKKNEKKLNIFSLILIILGLAIIIGISGCDLSDEDINRISNNAIVCNDPYMRLGTGCCLDTNNNAICDKDEAEQDLGEFPVSCTITPGISCDEFLVDYDVNGIAIKLRNGMGDDLTSVSIVINEPDSNIKICTLICEEGCTGDNIMLDGKSTTWASKECSDIGIKGSRFEGDILFTYTGSGGLSHTKTGSIIAKVK